MSRKRLPRPTLEAERQSLETERDQWQQGYEAANREVRRQLAERICLSQRVLGRSVSGIDELVCQSAGELQEQAEQLEQEVTEKIGPA